ncbi:MAG: phosphoribosylanthranilate isomerase [Rhodospirillaceae bacterium]|nr:phosphoribosylanthranilate isomerase [Rhodospirillaceae bacterium]
MAVIAKICGLKTAETVDAAVAHGAGLVGFNFYPRSPRAIGPAQAKLLGQRVPAAVLKVGLFVDDGDARIAEILAGCALDVLQLHGHETPDRVAEIRARFGKPVIKVLSVSGAGDLDPSGSYAPVVDYLMFDAKPPKTMAGALPGGNALSFDWTLLAGRSFGKPWLLAGGLTPDNVAEAVRMTGAPMVDVSSGVEDRPGEKNVSKIKAFLDAVKRL